MPVAGIGGEVLAVIAHVALERLGHLIQVGKARRAPRLLSRRGQRRQQHPRQDRDDGDHDKQLDQGEATTDTVVQ